MTNGPTAPSKNRFTCWAWGENLRLKPIKTIGDGRLAMDDFVERDLLYAVTTSSSSSALSASGFSTKTFLPDFSESTTNLAWRLWRAAMKTLPISLLARISAGSVVANWKPKILATFFALSPLALHTPTNDASENLRTCGNNEA